MISTSQSLTQQPQANPIQAETEKHAKTNNTSRLYAEGTSTCLLSF